jgi:hypothetical protein
MSIIRYLTLALFLLGIQSVQWRPVADRPPMARLEDIHSFFNMGDFNAIVTSAQLPR